MQAKRRIEFWHVILIIMSSNMRFPTMWYVRRAEPQISLHIRAVWSEPLLAFEYSMNILLLTKQHFECLFLKGSCTGSSESTHVKMPHCWKSHARALIIIKTFPTVQNYSLSSAFFSFYVLFPVYFYIACISNNMEPDLGFKRRWKSIRYT